MRQSLPTIFDNFEKVALGFDRLFDDLTNMEQFKCPLPYNLLKYDDGTLALEIAFAGYKKSDLSVELNGDRLNISANKVDVKAQGHEYIHKGMSSGIVKTSFLLGDGYEIKSASFCDGVLTILLSKVTPDANIKQIDIL